MKKLHSKSGFTLLEIIVVLIIVGVLAAIALPNLFANIERSRSAEALTNLSSMKSAVEGCIQVGGGVATSCTALTSMGFATTNANFAYTIRATGAGGLVTLGASRVGATYNGLSLMRDTGGTWTCAGIGTYAGVCQ